MAKLPIGKATVRIEAGQAIELDRVDGDGTRWVRPLNAFLNERTLIVEGDSASRAIGVCIMGTDTGEWVFAAQSMPPAPQS